MRGHIPNTRNKVKRHTPQKGKMPKLHTRKLKARQGAGEAIGKAGKTYADIISLAAEHTKRKKLL